MKEIITTEATFINSYCQKDACPILKAQASIRTAEIPSQPYPRTLNRARLLCRQAGLTPTTGDFSSRISIVNKTTQELVTVRNFDGPVARYTCSEGKDLPEGENCGELVIGDIAIQGVDPVINRVPLESLAS